MPSDPTRRRLGGLDAVEANEAEGISGRPAKVFVEATIDGAEPCTEE